MKLLIIILLICSINLLKSQARIEPINYEKGYPLIDREYLKDSVNIGLIESLPSAKDSSSNKKIFVTSWNSFCTDGSYIIIITPEQAYLKSWHDNPNPNYLYWLIPITSKTYDLILKKEDEINADLNELMETKIEVETAFLEKGMDCSEILKKQYSKVIETINNQIVNEELKINLNNIFKPNKNIYLGWSEEIINESIPKAGRDSFD